MTFVESNQLRIAVIVTMASHVPLAREIARKLGALGVSVGIFGSGDERVLATVSEIGSATGVKTFTNLVLASPYSLPVLSMTSFVLMRTLQRYGWPRNSRRLFEAFVSGFAVSKYSACQALEAFQATHLICFEDGISGPAEYIAAADTLTIPVVVCPYEMSDADDFENLLNDKYTRNELHEVGYSGIGAALRRTAPQWIREHCGKSVTIIDPTHILARELTLGAVPNPWTVHGGRARRIAVESEQMLQLYRSEGIDDEKLTVTGSLYCDAMADTIAGDEQIECARRKACRLSPDCTSVLVSLPPSYHDQRGELAEFDKYEEVLDRLEALQKGEPSLRLSLSIHPNTLPKQKSLMKKTGLNIEDRWLISALPAYDVFLTCFSSTIRWALALGKPVINYDMYSFCLKTYDGTTGFFNTTRFDDVVAHLRGLGDPDSYHEVAKSMTRQRDHWGVIDGRAAERTISLLQSAAQPTVKQC